MSFNARTIESVKDILDAYRDVTDTVNNADRIVKQSFPEVLARAAQVGPAIPIPSCVQQVANTANQVTNTNLIGAVSNGKGTQVQQEINRYTNLVSQANSGSSGMVFNKVTGLMFGINDNSYTEFEPVVQSLRNASDSVASIASGS